MQIREGAEADFPGIRRILAESREAAQWEPAGYRVLVAENNGTVAGFLAWRMIAPDEAEILNLAVAPALRNRRVAQTLIEALPLRNLFLEVRKSNTAARALYRKAGFIEVGVRPGYYTDPEEPGIVMRRQS